MIAPVSAYAAKQIALPANPALTVTVYLKPFTKDEAPGSYTDQLALVIDHAAVSAEVVSSQMVTFNVPMPEHLNWVGVSLLGENTKGHQVTIDEILDHVVVNGVTLNVANDAALHNCDLCHTLGEAWARTAPKLYEWYVSVTPLNGICGSSNGLDLSTTPLIGTLCTKGVRSTVAGTGPWTWTCSGEAGGITANCEAYLNVVGTCGSANGVTTGTAPTSGLCSTGTASSVSGSSTTSWAWSCSGTPNNIAASCSAPVPVINGSCGSANNVATSTAPTSGLCSTGVASGVMGTGPWSWTCAGSPANIGGTSSCAAPKTTIFPGQAGNPVGYAAYAPLGTTPWPSGQAFTSGTAGNPTIYTGYVFSGSQTISGSYITFISCDFNAGTGGVYVTGSNISFIGSRFQSNNVESFNVLTTGSNLTFSYDSFTPLASFYTAPPNAVWPSSGAGTNATTQITNVNSINGNDGYQFGILINSGGPVTIDHSDFWGFANAIDFMSTSTQINVTNNWIHDAANASPQNYHTDGPGYLNGGAAPNNVLIQGNTIASLGNTNAIAFQAATSGYNNIQIIGNYLSGFGYTVAPGMPGNTHLTNSSFADNVFGTDIEPIYGPLYGWVENSGSNTVWKCNTVNVTPGTTWSVSGWTPNTSQNGKYWVPATSVASTTDWMGNTSCP